MAKQELTLEQKQTQRMALEQQRMLGQMLEKNDAEMTEFIDNKVNENQALEKKNDEDDEMGGSEPDRDTNARNNDAANDMTIRWHGTATLPTTAVPMMSTTGPRQ